MNYDELRFALADDIKGVDVGTTEQQIEAILDRDAEKGRCFDESGRQFRELVSAVNSLLKLRSALAKL